MNKEIFILSLITIILLGLGNGDLVGLTSILIVTLIIFILAERRPSVALILYVALIIRVSLIFLSNHSIKLPDSSGDAYWFEIQAYEWSQLGFPNVLYSFIGFDPTFQKNVTMAAFNSSFFVSYIVAIFYALTERSVMLGQSISLLFGTLSVLMSFIVSQKIWGKIIAIKVGWFVALFPSLILYSALIMREAYVCFFLLLALNHIVDWSRTGSLKSFFLIILSFMVTTVFHGGMIVGLMMFLLFFFLKGILDLLRQLNNSTIKLKSFLPLVFMSFLILYYFTNNVYIPKIGTISDVSELKKEILKKNIATHRGSAKYPDWIIAKSDNELFYKMPLKTIYFIFSPFPWDIKKISHLIGVFDGFLHMLLFYCIFLNRKAIWADPALRIIISILLVYLFVYGVAVGNFGTGLRHRAKFVVMFILLAAPLLPKFIFIKNKIKK